MIINTQFYFRMVPGIYTQLDILTCSCIPVHEIHTYIYTCISPTVKGERCAFRVHPVLLFAQQLSFSLIAAYPGNPVLLRTVHLLLVPLKYHPLTHLSCAVLLNVAGDVIVTFQFPFHLWSPSRNFPGLFLVRSGPGYEVPRMNEYPGIYMVNPFRYIPRAPQLTH